MTKIAAIYSDKYRKNRFDLSENRNPLTDFDEIWHGSSGTLRPPDNIGRGSDVGGLDTFMTCHISIEFLFVFTARPYCLQCRALY